MEFYKQKESVEQYLIAAKGHNGKDLIQKVRPLLPSEALALELGSGPGSDWEILNEFCEVIGSDNSNLFLERLKDRHPKGKFISLDASHFSFTAQYDLIYSNKVLHHLDDDAFKSSLSCQWEALKPAGLIAHSLWKGSGSENFEGMFVNYHLADELQALLASQFELLHLESYQEFEPEDSLFLIARKKRLK